MKGRRKRGDHKSNAVVFTFWRTRMENYFPSSFTETVAGISLSFLDSQEMKVVLFCKKENLIILGHFFESFHIPCSNTYNCVGFNGNWTRMLMISPIKWRGLGSSDRGAKSFCSGRTWTGRGYRDGSTVSPQGGPFKGGFPCSIVSESTSEIGESLLEMMSDLSRFPRPPMVSRFW